MEWASKAREMHLFWEPVSMPRVLPFLLFLLCLSPLGAQTGYSTPDETYQTYLKACSSGDYVAAEGCYTRSSRELVDKTRTKGEEPAPESLQMLHARLEPLTYKIEEVNPKRAIVWFDDKSVPPLFLRIQDKHEGWRLDYHFMSHYIRAGKDGWSWRNKRVFKLWKSRE